VSGTWEARLVGATGRRSVRTIPGARERRDPLVVFVVLVVK
jgi:hypothetical protein